VAKFLVDANLLQTYNLWQDSDFLYAVQLNIERNDQAIWTFSSERNLTILSRDMDFANRILHFTPPPKVIHFRIGNMRYPTFRAFMNANWQKSTFYSLNYKLVLVYPDAIEGIN